MAGAENRRAHPHDGGAFLHGDVEVVAHPHRQLAELFGRHAAGGQPVPDFAQPFEPRPGVFRILRIRWQHISPTTWAARSRPAASNSAGRSASRRAELGGLACQVHLNQQFRATFARAAAASSSRPQQVEAVNRVDIGERSDDLSRLVRLQMTDKVPPTVKFGRFADFL